MPLVEGQNRSSGALRLWSHTKRRRADDEAQRRGGFTCEAPAHAGVAMFEAVAFGYVEV